MQNDDELKKEKRREFRENDDIDKLKSRMYSRSRLGFLPWRRRHKSKLITPLAKDNWDYSNKNEQKGNDDVYKSVNTTKSSYLFVKVIFGIAIAFLILAVVGSMVYLFIGTNKSIVNASVNLSVEGVSSISAGDILDLQIIVVNKNDKRLELSDIIVKYPDGTVSPVDFKTLMKAERIPLGIVDKHSARRGVIRAVVFGKEGDTRNIKINLQYRLDGSSVLYSKSIEHSILITNDAVGVTVDGNTEMTVNQSMPIIVKIKSYSTSVLNGVFLDLEMPFGFEMSESSPPPLNYGEVEDVNKGKKKIRWAIGALSPGEERSIYISTIANGQEGESRYLQFDVGVGLNEEAGIDTSGDTNSGASGELVILTAQEHQVIVHRPFLDVELASGGLGLDDVIAHSGRRTDINVNWRNNINEPINDVSIKIALDGSALDKNSVKLLQGGFYRSIDSLLLWDSKTTPDVLKTVGPGGSGTLRFNLAPLSVDYLKKIRTPEITLRVYASAKRFNESGVPEELLGETSYIIKVSTDASFNSYGLFRSSQFGSYGPMPPKVEHETRYEIVWEISNTTSDLEDAVVKADLPHYVRWVGLTSPSNEQLLYNKSAHTIEWNLGKVEAGTGVGERKLRKVSFVLGFVPSTSQISSMPDLIYNQMFTAEDVYTGEQIGIKGEEVNTRITLDPEYKQRDATVVK